MMEKYGDSQCTYCHSHDTELTKQEIIDGVTYLTIHCQVCGKDSVVKA